MTMREFDFRFQGIDPLKHPDKVQRLRDCLLELAGGFTEIRPGVLVALIPGDGTGYIVALPDQESLEALIKTLARLAGEWGGKAPDLQAASTGPRRGYGFFLLPKLANRESSRQVDKDVSYIFVFRLHSPDDISWFECFIQNQVFANGKECDQETIYLSAAGEGRHVYQPD